jgi:lysyl-tRNA synthetase class 2
VHETARLDPARRERLRTRHAVLRAIRQFFDARDYLEVDTPARVPSPGLDVHLDAFEVPGGAGPRFLHTSPEYQMKRLVAGGLPRVYQLGKAFRRDEVGHLHQPEFCMLEWYRAGASYADLMAETEQLVASVALGVLGATRLPSGLELGAPWRRLTVRDAFRELAGVEADSLLDDEERFFRVLVDQVEPRLGFERPTLLCDYPLSMASLARPSAADPSVAERFEAYLNGVELCNGFGELTDAREQRRRLLADQARRRELGKPVYPIDERFLAALEQGLPSCAGNALGVDRLVMLLTGATHIRDVICFADDEL